MEITRATTASKVEPSDHSTLTTSDPPCLRSRLGKRRWATSSTMAGVMNIATSNRHSSTISGVARTSTSSGANTVRREPRPSLSSQPRKACTRSKASSQAATDATAPSQKK